jgi:hypothetical protein
VLCDFNRDKETARTVANVDEPLLSVLKNQHGDGFAADSGKYPQAEKAATISLLEERQLRIVRSHETCVVEHIFQVRLEGLQTAKVNYPVVVVKLGGTERKFYF